MNSAYFQTPNLKRFFDLSRKVKKLSITRVLQYEVLDKLRFDGPVLDFGGGERAKYRERIKCPLYHSINIDAAIEPTWLVDVGGKFPCSAEFYQYVLSLNTLEHIHDAEFVLKECFRALKPGGELLAFTPFLFPIHGHPDDYFRPTPSWYSSTLSRIGFSNIRITPLAWGPMTTGATCSGMPGPFKWRRRQFAMALDWIYAKLVLRRHSDKMIFQMYQKIAVAFYVQASKK